MRAVAGLQPATSGDTRLMGQRVEGGADVLRHVGFTPDTPPLYDDLSVADFLRFIAKGYDIGSAEAEERIDFCLDKVWLTEKRDQKIKALSCGMRQRVGIARTLLPNPVAVLLDEPAAGLDPAGRAQFRQLLSSLRDQGKVLIVSSHILADMEEYCTHIAIMSAGRLQRFGTVREIAQTAHVDGRCRYTITLVSPVAKLDGWFEGIEGVSEISIDRDRIVLEYSNEKDSAAKLLAELVRRKLQVAAFSPNAAGLEEAYLRTGIKQVD